jgi:hypothetical protein
LKKEKRTSTGESCVGVGVDEDLHVEHISRLFLQERRGEEENISRPRDVHKELISCKREGAESQHTWWKMRMPSRMMTSAPYTEVVSLSLRMVCVVRGAIDQPRRNAVDG